MPKNQMMVGLVLAAILFFMSLMIGTAQAAQEIVTEGLSTSMGQVQIQDEVQVQTQNSRSQESLRSTSSMVVQALRVFDYLNEDQKQKALIPFDSKERQKWNYHASPRGLSGILLPGHSGISIMDLTPDQRLQVSRLLDTALANKGMEAVAAAVQASSKEAPAQAGFFDRLIYEYGPENYYLTFFGSPRDDQWGWRFEGHLISLNFTIQSGYPPQMNPIFVGTPQAQIQLTSGKTADVLKNVIRPARELMQSLAQDQAQQALAGKSFVPNSLLLAPGVFGGTHARPDSQGLAYKDMSPSQKVLMRQILNQYLVQFEPALRSTHQGRVAKDLNNIKFVMAGDPDAERAFYFRIQNEGFAFELLGEKGESQELHSLWINF